MNYEDHFDNYCNYISYAIILLKTIIIHYYICLLWQFIPPAPVLCLFLTIPCLHQLFTPSRLSPHSY
ncbi:hypothetical protein EB796_021036 [Bugula neritina]|uniref:Uncharacterized protein n=1 Tax=Bugula neritina TaxID=10212 RepID=A0A7J7J4S8_BUGNE|nr:hypothetical protein EB796_021036 [Bugula neritina]